MSASASLTVIAYADATTDITADVLFPASGEWGIDGNGAEDRIASTGFLEFDVRNYGSHEGKYVFGHASCMAGWKKGTPVELKFTFDGNTVTHRRYVQSTEVVGTRKERAHIVCTDWIEYASTHSVINPDLLEDATGDQGVAEILANMPIAPQSTNLDVGVISHPTLLDTSSRFSSAYSELSKIANSELGYLYLRQPEILRFENLMSRNGTRELSEIPSHSSVSGYILDEDSNTLTDEDSNRIVLAKPESIEVDLTDITRWEDENGNNVINTFESTVHPRRTDTETIILYEPERPPFIASGEVQTFRAFWVDPDSKRSINARPPTEDPYTKALLHFEGDPGHQVTFEDAVGGRVWTANDVELVRDVFGTAPKFGKSCAYMDGSTSYISSPYSPIFEFADDDWTIDWWEYRFATTSGVTSVNRDATIATPPFRLGRSNGTNLLIDISSNGVTNDIANGKSLGSITTGQWVHLEVGRQGSNFYAFKNGVMTANWTSTGIINASTAAFYIGRNQSTYFDGTIDEFRISKGVCRHTDDFTPETAAYTLQGTFLSAFENEDGTGDELTNDFLVSVDYGTEGATYTITNNSSSSGYYFLKTLGYGIHLDSPLEDRQINQASIDEHGDQSTRLDLSYHQEKYYGILEGKRVIEAEKDSRTVLSKIHMKANKSNGDMLRFLHSDVGDLVRVNIDDRIAKDAYFNIHRIGYNINAGDISYWWLLKEHYSLAKGLDDLAVEFNGGANTDCITFDYMPYVCGDSIQAFSISAWVYLDTEPTSNSYYVAGPFMDGAGSMLLIGTTDRKVVFYTTRFSTSPGQWSSPADPFSLSTWAHVVLTYTLSVSLDPKIYVNGNLQTLTEDVTPAGNLMSAKGANFFIGNAKTPALNYTRCFDGKIKDVRYYPYVLSQTEVTTIHNGGTQSSTVGNTGQVFQAFAVHSSRYADYQDLTLTSATKLLDAHLGMVGTANGSPVARYP